MKRPGKQLLSGTCFSLDQYGGIGRPNLTDTMQYRRQGGTVADDLFKIMPGLDFLDKTGTFPFELPAKFIDLLKCKVVLQRKGELRDNQTYRCLIVIIKRAGSIGNNQTGTTARSIP